MDHEVRATRPVVTRTSSDRALAVRFKQRFGAWLHSTKQNLGEWLIAGGEKLVETKPKLTLFHFAGLITRRQDNGMKTINIRPATIGLALIIGCGGTTGEPTTTSDTATIASAAPGPVTTSDTGAPVTSEPTTTTEIQRIDPLIEEALAVATAFTQGRADQDIDEMKANGIDGHIQGFLGNSFETMPDEFAWQQAVGWTIEVTECEITNPDIANTRVTCHVTHSNDISRALERGPFDGAYHMRVMYEGDQKLNVTITRTTVTESLEYHFPQSEFTTGSWRPFVTWLEQTYPEDMNLMLGPPTPQGHEDGLVPPGDRPPLTTPESIELWRQHVQEYVSELS